jgi:hypothetical protein
MQEMSGYQRSFAKGPTPDRYVLMILQNAVVILSLVEEADDLAGNVLTSRLN